MKTVIFAIVLVLTSISPFLGARAAVLQILYSFSGQRDGGTPTGGLMMGADGNLYGTTEQGGTHNDGTIFKLAPNGKETVLHNFAGGKNDGLDPDAGLIADGNGNLFGTTNIGGKFNLGTIFVLPAVGKLKVLYSFRGGTKDGSNPRATLLLDGQGSLYGTTPEGGAGGAGTVFRLDPNGTEKILYSFSSFGGGVPVSGVIADVAGNLYGATHFGGNPGCQYFCGTVFRVSPDGTETDLYRFTGGADGGEPFGDLITDKSGNLLGAAYVGGDCCCLYGCGVVYSVATNGTETVLYHFNDRKNDGSYPHAGLVADADGNLYGTTEQGGTDQSGVAFELKHESKEKILYNLPSGLAKSPRSSLVVDANGNLYGTAPEGGNFGFGAVFKIINTSKSASNAPPY